MILTVEQTMPRDELIHKLDSLEDFVYDKAKDYDCNFDSIDGKIEELYNLTGKFEKSNCVHMDVFHNLVGRVDYCEIRIDEERADRDAQYQHLNTKITNIEATRANKYDLNPLLSRINFMETRIAEIERRLRKAGF